MSYDNTETISCDNNLDISSEDINEMAEESEIDAKYIEQSINLQRADEFFKNADKKEKTNSDKKLSLNKIKYGLKLLQKIIYTNAYIPNYATVTNVKASKKTKNITIISETEYPELPEDKFDDRLMTESKTFELPEDKKKLEYLLNKANVDAPSELIGEKIPTIPKLKTESRRRISEIEYETHIPKFTLWGRGKYMFKRTCMKLKLVERASSEAGHKLSVILYLIKIYFY